MFHFPTFPLPTLFYSDESNGTSFRRVSPFGHPRLSAYTRLGEAYRNVLRPSSDPTAKASPVYVLVFIFLSSI